MKQTIEMLDNKSQGSVISKLKENIASNNTVSVISDLFSLYAFYELKKQLKNLAKFKLLLHPLNNKDNFIDNLLGSDLDRHLRNQLTISHIAKECSTWLDKKAEIRQAQSTIGQNLINIAKTNQDESLAILMGSSSFNTDGLGIMPSDTLHMINCFYAKEQTQNYINWFNQFWNAKHNKNFLIELQQALKAIYYDKTAQQIYFLTLFNLFKENISELNEDEIIKTKTGVKDTLVWQKLYKFQRDGVLGAIEKIEKYNGCIIADSVGLGKTFEALAVIKYYELRNDRVLVLCPKKLRENWSIYTINDKRNIFATDRFNFDVLNHSDLTRTQGKSGEINLATIHWDNYDLVVIDESHNFRNNPSYKEGSLTRYSKLMNHVITSGVKTKVLMLSATPVNNRMNDLKNQLAFIVEGKDDALKANNITSIAQTLKKAQTHFNTWLDLDENLRTPELLLKNLNFDYFKLLDLLTIARSRQHIEKYYDLTEVGKFPARLKPINIYTDIDTQERFPSIADINRDIRTLNLSAYAPLRYVLPHKKQDYSQKYDKKVAHSVFKQSDREESLTQLIRTNLLKRLESSVNSFTLTLDKLLNGVNNLLDKIKQHKSNTNIEELDITEIETEDETFAPFLIGDKIKVLIQDMDTIRWQQELTEDKDILEQLIASAKQVKVGQDEKLRRTKEIIKRKVANPINPNNKKLIIFTAFADTAKYLYDNIAEWAEDELSVYSALVTGSNENKTTMPEIRKDLLSIITCFSPISKERDKIDTIFNAEIDILIATDCIAEGQNLQDCDYLINYDIHWNPVRIIQRFGRIDRLGSKNSQIQLVNFWPNIELDEYINLVSRVSGRMVLLDISATGEENIIDANHGKMKDLEYRRKQLQKLQSEVVNLDELESGISITDLTLNDFRMDLSDYLSKNETELETMPLGAYAVADISNGLPDNIVPGVIFLLKNTGKQLPCDKNYALLPYYLIYVADDGSIQLQFDQTKKLIDILKKITNYNKFTNTEAIECFATLTNSGANMSHYQQLLAKAVQSLTGVAEQQGVASLFSPGGTTIDNHSFKGIDDFEVISYLILLDSTNIS